MLDWHGNILLFCIRYILAWLLQFLCERILGSRARIDRSLKKLFSFSRKDVLGLYSVRASMFRERMFRTNVERFSSFVVIFLFFFFFLSKKKFLKRSKDIAIIVGHLIFHNNSNIFFYLPRLFHWYKSKRSWVEFHLI